MASDESRKSMIFFRSWRDALDGFPDVTRLKVYDAILAYAFDGVEVEMDGLVKMAFSFCKEQIDINQDAYIKTVEARREAGRKGGIARAQNQANPSKSKQTKQMLELLSKPSKPKQTQANQADNDNDNDNVLSKDNDIKKENIKKKREQFKEPTKEDIQDYATQKGLPDHSEDFMLYYKSNGWMVGRNKMKDWRSAYCRWCRTTKQLNHGQNKHNNDAEQRRIDISASIARDIAQCH